MPLGPGVRYRYKKGTNVRLAFGKGGNVVEAKNMTTGATHTPEEFTADRQAVSPQNNPKRRGLQRAKTVRRFQRAARINDSSAMPDEMGQVHVGGGMVRQPTRSLGKFCVLVALMGLLSACASLKAPSAASIDSVHESREACWAMGGFILETADEGVCLPLPFLPRILELLDGGEPSNPNKL